MLPPKLLFNTVTCKKYTGIKPEKGKKYAKVKISNSEITYDVKFNNIAPNVVQVLEKLPFSNNGFTLSRDD